MGQAVYLRKCQIPNSNHQVYVNYKLCAKCKNTRIQKRYEIHNTNSILVRINRNIKHNKQTPNLFMNLERNEIKILRTYFFGLQVVIYIIAIFLHFTEMKMDGLLKK